MSFGRDIERIAAKTRKSIEEVMRGAALELFSSVIKDTPVDTGRARGNWQASIGSAEDGETTATEAVALSKVRSVTSGWSIGEVIWLTNNLPYARRLEYGWSKQAPGGMVRKNVARIQRIVKAQAAKQ